ncbi:DUF1127 domain-containing protein [Phyllobacterium brassicacearum]|uniref:DUF1127 domain-containing protein n=1 Tax=Phyllobacterium brassicacearum TaxID=314235 RepID=A0A2P7B829_9HYPH|nr:DUF1127 domain-containing protein [Phyllobacterium brassicacearum]PSH62623.1 DUF1127 domain-containing protein [Phyllobacterium brassicacearum]TDQ09192.1 uncharacterized protein DUF1127 [Phyllobacterium brassicacearum]
MREAQFDSLAATVDELCQKFGVWNTARALLLAVLRRRQTKNQISHLSNRMRRDIGVPDSEEVEVTFSPGWEIRRFI